MNSDLNFRAWDGERFHFWGYDVFDHLPSGIFTGPPNPSWPSTQYILMKDKNQKKIFVGDFIQLSDASGNSVIVEVKFGIHRRLMGSGYTVDIPGFAFIKGNTDPTFPIVFNYKGVHDLELFEVVGNIFQTPELLQS